MQFPEAPYLSRNLAMAFSTRSEVDRLFIGAKNNFINSRAQLTHEASFAALATDIQSTTAKTKTMLFPSCVARFLYSYLPYQSS